MTSVVYPEISDNWANEVTFRRAMQLSQTPICDDPDHTIFEEYQKYIDQLTIVWGEEKLRQKIENFKTVYAMMGVPI
jgi:hypothetical protein